MLDFKSADKEATIRFGPRNISICKNYILLSPCMIILKVSSIFLMLNVFPYYALLSFRIGRKNLGSFNPFNKSKLYVS